MKGGCPDKGRCPDEGGDVLMKGVSVGGCCLRRGGVIHRKQKHILVRSMQDKY